VTKNKKPFF